jgi:hypothetical protein
MNTLAEIDGTSSAPPPTELDAWKQVHATLTEAVKRAQEAVSVRKSQRRFWMEEICSNMTDDGKQKTSSVWKRPVGQKKPARRGPAAKVAGTKRKKKDLTGGSPDKATKKPRKKKEDGDPDAPKSKKIKISLKKKGPVDSFLPQAAAEDDESESNSQDEQGGGMPPKEYVHMPQPGPPWGGGHNPLQMMVRIGFFVCVLPFRAVGSMQFNVLALLSFSLTRILCIYLSLTQAAVAAFGGNNGYPPNGNAGYPPQAMMQQPYNPYYAQQPPPGMPPQHPYAPPPPPNMARTTYSSIHDVGNSDEDSHEDQF